MVDHFSAYIYQKRGFYYFSRRVPKQLQHCHSKQRIVFALNTRSRAKALKHAQVICQRLDERWLPMRPDAMGLNFVPVMVNIDDHSNGDDNNNDNNIIFIPSSTLSKTIVILGD